MNHAPTSILVDAGHVAGFTMRHSYTESRDCSCGDAGASARQLGVCDIAFLGIVLWTLVHTTEALASDQAQLPGSSANRDLDAARQPLQVPALISPIPQSFQAANLPDSNADSAAEFRPRKHSNSDLDDRSRILDDESIMRSTSVWQRLSESRSRDRVQVVTLWETGGNSLSLQAGRKGDPTLQWTSRLMSHGGGAHGLLDELFSTTVGGAASRGLHLLSRAANSEPGTKASKPAEAPSGTGAAK